MTATTTRLRRRLAEPEVTGGRARARADLWPLVVAALVVALTVALAVVTPRLVHRTADAAVREAVSRAGPAVDLTVTVPPNVAPVRLSRVTSTEAVAPGW